MEGQPVAMLVDLVVDRYISGTPKRISREAPVLILRFDSETLAPGGGANAVANVAALEGKPLPVGIVGDDEAGRYLLTHLTRNGIETRGILTRAGYRTPTKTRILGGARHAIKQQIVRYDIEDNISLTESERQRFLEVFGSWSPLHAIVLSDYGYGTVDPGLLPTLRELLGADCMFLGDSRYRLEAFAGLDVATPNTEEAEALLRESIEVDAALSAQGERLRASLRTKHLLITQGSSGMSLFSPAGMAHIPVHGTDQVADVTGAGDTVIGTLALALAAGATPLEATCLANYAGGIVVMKAGTATVSREELRRAIEADPTPREELKWVAS